jgi:ABC-2 type transport system ATP-binding protein
VAAPAIGLVELTKYFGRVVGVEHLSLEVQPGEIFGFLGANGAGKTTTIRMLLDLLRPTSGSASILGLDCHRDSLQARRQIGYLPGEMPYYPELSGAGYLSFLASLAPARPSPARIRELLTRFDVSDLDLTRPMREYSHGMKRKLGIVQALMGDAPVVLLDEPTSGLDPLMIEAFAQTIAELERSGRTTVFLSSHVLSEVERTCTRIALIRRGRLAGVRTLAELRASSPRRVTVTFSRPVAPPAEAHDPGNPAEAGLYTVGNPAEAGLYIVTRGPTEWVIDVVGPLGPLVASLATLPVADLHVAPFALEKTVLELMEGGRS